VFANDGDPDVVTRVRRALRPARGQRSLRAGRRKTTRFRRSPHLVAYWRSGSLLIVNYATRTTARADPLICEILNFCSGWRTLADIEHGLPVPLSPLLPTLVERLVSLSLLQQSDRAIDPRVIAMNRLEPWNPEVGFFHNATRDVRFWSARETRKHARTVDRSAMPGPVKRYRGIEPVRLTPPSAPPHFAEVLTARRTSRRFSVVPVSLGELSTILAFTAGVQQWAQSEGGQVPLKTSPSGGARHPIECYVVSRSIAGLKAGIYHYRSDAHALERIGPGVSIERMRAYVPHSGYFASASAMVFFTAVFERQLWRYPYSRAYRAALIEAGHVCQTFLLTATSIGLAPFCVMGLADTLVEHDLGIDGIGESVLYCAGVGRPPRGTAFAPLAHGTLAVRPNRRLQG
jgi:SagB-type dehydrogenase family enzyme